MSAKTIRPIKPKAISTQDANQHKTCKGWNFHVYTLGSNKCSICGQGRSA